jgi:hypothetical protein
MVMLGSSSSWLIEAVGFKVVSATGGLIIAFALVWTSFATVWWQLLLTQGVLLGIGCSMAFFPSIIVLSYSFTHKRVHFVQS